MTKSKKPFHLSVVATARNDNHGENFLCRMQLFVDGFIEQCKKFQLHAELIIVEWNPPEEKEPLYKALKFPTDKEPCAIRFIRVPKEVHSKLQHADRLPLFQMIAKNVGIQRAQGEFILATNVDILFSNPLMKFLCRRLKKGYLYRTDRLDVPAYPPNGPMKKILNFCKKNYFRINGKNGTTARLTPESPRYLYHLLKLWYDKLFPTRHQLHTNASGDFTLLSHDDWQKLKGYYEWEMHSWHLDGILLHQAHHLGIQEVHLPRKRAIYHIDHSIGSGYTSEVPDALFKQLKEKGIPFLTNETLSKIITNTASFPCKKDNWGMADQTFEEIWM